MMLSRAHSHDGGAEEQRRREEATAALFTSLVERCNEPLVRLVERIVHDRDEAHDIVQEAFLRAFRNIDSCRPGQSIEGWLYKIARNAALDVYRRRRRDRAFFQIHEADVPVASPEELVVRSDEADRIHDALGDLPVRYREALEWNLLHDLGYRDVAERLGIPVGTVKTWISRGKRRLRDDRRLRVVWFRTD
jgi:RNA polymerase sigma-70 factor (ECF subfamily)